MSLSVTSIYLLNAFASPVPALRSIYSTGVEREDANNEAKILLSTSAFSLSIVFDLHFLADIPVESIIIIVVIIIFIIITIIIFISVLS